MRASEGEREREREGREERRERERKCIGERKPSYAKHILETLHLYVRVSPSGGVDGPLGGVDE